MCHCRIFFSSHSSFILKGLRTHMRWFFKYSHFYILQSVLWNFLPEFFIFKLQINSNDNMQIADTKTVIWRLKWVLSSPPPPSLSLSIYSYLFGTFFMNIKRFSMIDKYRYLSMILLFFIAVSFNVCKLITFNNLGITIHFYELRTFLISFFHIYFHLRPIKPLAI